jgi:hypothetical protein
VSARCAARELDRSEIDPADLNVGGWVLQEAPADPARKAISHWDLDRLVQVCAKASALPCVANGGRAMRLVKLTVGVTAMVSLTVVPGYAQHGNSGNHAPSTGATSHEAAPTTHGSSSAHGSSSTTHGDSAKAHGPSSKPSGDAAATGTSTKTTKTGSDSTSTGSTSTSSTSTSSTGGTTTTKIDFTATPVGQKLSRNTALNSKLVTRLQAEGYTGSVYQAAYGFKNLGQFVAATNVSKNLGIPFQQLKVQMTGVSVAADGTVLKAMTDASGKVTLVDPSKTTDPSLSPAATKSLGQSIQTLKSGVDSTTAAQTATTQADAEIAGTSTAPTTSTSTTTTPRKTAGSSASR